MTQPFIDTNVIIRFLTVDDLRKQAAATSLFEQNANYLDFTLTDLAYNINDEAIS